MSDKLREAAQRALETLEDIFGKNKIDVGAINMLRAALAEPAIKDSLTVQRPWVGLTDREFQPMIQKAMAYYGYDQSEPSHLTAGAGFRVFANAIESRLKDKNS